MGEFWIFIGALAVAYLLPGPDMILVLQQSATRGVSHALATAIGLAISRAAHVTLAAAGLAALLRTTPIAFDIIKFVGSLYLVWVGLSILRAASLLPPTVAQAENREPSYRDDLARGVLTNFLNPKPLLFCSVLLPQFIHPERQDVAGQFLLLGAVLIVLGFVFDGALSWVGSGLRGFLSTHPRIQVVQKWIFGSLLIGFGVRLALTAKP